MLASGTVECPLLAIFCATSPLHNSAIGATSGSSQGNEARHNRRSDITQAEQNLADDKMRAEIAKMLTKTKQISVNTFLAPFLAAAGVIGATAAVIKIFF